VLYPLLYIEYMKKLKDLKEYSEIIKQFKAINTQIYATMLACDIRLLDPSSVSHTFHLPLALCA